MSQERKPTSFTNSSSSWKSSGGVPDQFPVGLRVLVVDDDSAYLLFLERMLRNCLYKVTKCNQAGVALRLLREKKDGFDIVISEVHMPDMDGIKLLQRIRLEMDLPVIMISTDYTKKLVMKGIIYGACDYLIKPVHLGALKNIWQHVVRKKKYEWKEIDSEQLGSAEHGEQLQKPLEDLDQSPSVNEGHCKNSKRRKDNEDEIEERDDTSTFKKPRVVWSTELHQQFETAVNQLGVDNAVPKKILEIMNVPGLKRENVASHLQKYRLHLRKVNSPNALGAFPAISSLSGLHHLQTLAASNQLLRHCVTPIQTTRPSLGRIATKPAIYVPPGDQRKILSFRNPKMRFTVGQQLSDNVKQVNLLHRVPTNMDSKQHITLQHAAQAACRDMNLNISSPANQNNLLHTQMVQPQPRAQISNEINGPHSKDLPSVSKPQTIPVNSASQPSIIVDFSSSQRTELTGNSFSLVSSSKVSTLSPKGVLQEDFKSEVKGHQSFFPNYDIISEQNQVSTEFNQDWVMHHGSSNLEDRGHPNFQAVMDISPSLVDPGFSLNPEIVQSKTGFSVADGMDNQEYDNNLLSIKAENFGDIDLYCESIEKEDFMTPCNKQPQLEGMDDEFGIEDYQLDHLFE